MALLALSSLKINTSVVNKSRKALNSLAGQFYFFVICVSKSQKHFRQQKGDELPKSGASLDETEAEILPCQPGTIKRQLITQFKQNAQG